MARGARGNARFGWGKRGKDGGEVWGNIFSEWRFEVEAEGLRMMVELPRAVRYFAVGYFLMSSSFLLFMITKHIESN